MAVIPTNAQIFKYSLITGIIFFLFAPQASGQQLTSRNKKAIAWYQQGDNYRVRRQYDEAIRFFQLAVSKDKEFAEAYYLLGLTYGAKGLIYQARENLVKASGLFPEEKMPYTLYIELASMNFMMGENAEAQLFAEKYLQKEKRNQKGMDYARKLLRDISFIQNYEGDPHDLKPEYLPPSINKYEMQYFPALTADQLSIIYTTRSQTSDENMVIATRDSLNGEWSEPRGISKIINTPANEGTCSISADGRTLIFTGCQGWPVIGGCDLFISRKKGDEWSKPENLGSAVNSRAWDSQPSLSADGRTIYFVSNRPGGQGGRDLWFSTLSEEGEWLPAQNMGQEINTKADELSPFIHASNTYLYFASDGHPGFGGVDLFFTEYREENWTAPKNIGNSVNNREDQLGMVISTDGKKAYYSDEKASGFGHESKIAMFDVPQEMQITAQPNYVFGEVSDAETGALLEATIELFGLSEQKKIFQVTSDPVSGKYLMVLPDNSEFALYSQKEGYLFYSGTFSVDTLDERKPIRKDIQMKPAKEGAEVVLSNLFFAFDSYELEEKSKLELDKVIRMLEKDSALKIQITGHTDNSGSDQYNKNLSEKRAESVVRYLISRGIEERRLRFSGKGSADPLVPNSSEANKAINRRIEMKVI